jgi:PKD repeat protein
LLAGKGKVRKKGLASVFLIFLLSSYAVAVMSGYFIQRAYAQNSTVSVSPDTNTFEVGQTFLVNLTISEVYNLHLWQLNLQYDSSILSTTAGNVLPGPEFASANFYKTVTANNVYIGCVFSATDYTVENPGVLAKITFTVITNGKSNLHLYGVMLQEPLNPPNDPNIPQDPPIDGLFYTQTPAASFYYLPSTTAGTPGYLIPDYLIRDPIVGEVLTFNASYYSSYGFYAGSYDPNPGGSIVNYNWDFGDGNITSSGLNPVITHTYPTQGSYNTNLTVTDNEGKTNSFQKSATIVKHDVAISGITVTPTVASPGENISIQVNITNLGTQDVFVNATLYYDSTLIWYNSTLGHTEPSLQQAYSSPLEWERETSPPYALRKVIFSPGKTIQLNYTWATAGLPIGSYTIHANISLVWQNATVFLKDVYLKEMDYNITNNDLTLPDVVTLKELSNIAVTDIALSPTLQLPNVISYGQSPVSVKVTIENTGGFDESFYVSLYYNSTLLMNWTDVSLLSKTQTTLEYTWNPSTLARGPYILTAQASNVTGEVENGRTGDNKLTFEITITSVPSAVFTYSPTKPLIHDIIHFNATDSAAALGWTITQYKWIFNGIVDPTMTTTTAQRTYSTGGDYNITLEVKDSVGIVNSISHIIHVSIMPTSQFTFAPSAPKVDQAITFNASLSTADAEVSNGLDTIVSYRWNFSNGFETIFVGANLTNTLTYSFAKSGNFSVTLTVMDGEGFNNSITKFILVSRIDSTLSFTLSTNTIKAGQNITVTGQVTPVRSGVQVTFLYKLGTGDWATLSANVVSDQSGNYLYVWTLNTVGNYTVKARIGSDDKYNGVDSRTLTFEVQESTPPPPTSTPLDLTPYVAAAVVIIIVVAVGVYFMRRRK